MSRGMLAATVAFALALAASAAPAAAQETVEEVVSFTASLVPGEAATDGKMVIALKIKPGWHIYSLTQKDLPATKIALSPIATYELAGPFTSSPAPETKEDETLDLVVETHSDAVQFTAPIKLKSGGLGSLTIPGTLKVQACTESICLPPKTLRFTAKPAGK